MDERNCTVNNAVPTPFVRDPLAANSSYESRLRDVAAPLSCREPIRVLAGLNVINTHQNAPFPVPVCCRN